MTEMLDGENDDVILEEMTEFDCCEPLSEDVPSDRIYSYSKQTLNEINSNFRSGFEKFTEEDYKALQENIILYKQGNIEAGTYIISMFHQFISKYARFICYGKVSKEDKEFLPKKEAGFDKSLSRFVALFMSSKKNDDTSKDKYKAFAETCGKIQMLFSKFEYWDIYNELVCALLNMANKYKITKEGDKFHHANGSFHMYVSKCFHYEARNILSKLVEDPLAHNETYHIYEDSNKEIRDLFAEGVTGTSGGSKIFTVNPGISSVNSLNMTCYLKDEATEKRIDYILDQTDRQNALDNSDNLVLNEGSGIDPYDVESLNFNWTNGTTCSDLFKDLTSYERELVILSFVKNKTDSEIASIYGCHRVTIVNHKKQAVKKIKKAALIEKMVD